MIGPVTGPSFAQDVSRAALRALFAGVVLELGLRQAAWLWVGLMTFPGALLELRVLRRPVVRVPFIVTPALLFGLGFVALLAGLLQATYVENIVRTRSFDGALTATSDLVAALPGPFVRGGPWDGYFSWSPLWEWWESPRCPLDTALGFGATLAGMSILRGLGELLRGPGFTPAARAVIVALVGAMLGSFAMLANSPGDPPWEGRYTSLQGFEELAALMWFGALAAATQPLGALVVDGALAQLPGPAAPAPPVARFSIGRALVLMAFVVAGLVSHFRPQPGVLSSRYTFATAFTPDGALVGATSRGGGELWSVDGEGSIGSPPACGAALAFSPGGALGATVVGGDRVALWSVPDGRIVRHVAEDGFAPDAVAFSRDGRWLVVGGAYGGRVYSVADGALVRSLDDPPGGTWAGKLRLHSIAVTTSLVAATCADHPPRIWDLATGAEVARLALPYVDGWNGCVAAAPRGDRFAWTNGSGVTLTTADGSIAAVSTALPGGTTACAFSPDGRLVVAGCRRSLCILSAADATLVREIPGLRERALSVAWSSRGDVLAAAGPSGVRLFRLDTPAR